MSKVMVVLQQRRVQLDQQLDQRLRVPLPRSHHPTTSKKWWQTRFSGAVIWTSGTNFRQFLLLGYPKYETLFLVKWTVPKDSVMISSTTLADTILVPWLARLLPPHGAATTLMTRTMTSSLSVDTVTQLIQISRSLGFRTYSSKSYNQY